jgi:hypothetical protein
MSIVEILKFKISVDRIIKPCVAEQQMIVIGSIVIKQFHRVRATKKSNKRETISSNSVLESVTLAKRYMY